MTTQQKWTPGPWVAEPYQDGWRIWDNGKGFKSDVADIAIRRSITSKGPSAEEEANARLIAAAPAMAEALRIIAEGKGAYSRDPLEHASNVIDEAKAAARAILARINGEA